MDFNLLSQVLDARNIKADQKDLDKFSIDGLTPEAVVVPKSIAQAAELIELAAEQGWACAPVGGGVRLGLGGVPSRLDLAVSTAGLDKIIDMDTANLTVTAQAGVVLQDLNDLLTGLENRCYFPIDSDLSGQAEAMCSDRDYKGVFLPLDPPAAHKTTIGGLIATGAAGPKRLRYGLPRDIVLGVRFISPRGRSIGMGGKVVKNVSGFDVSKLMIGSLGVLGLVAEATFRLLPLPEKQAGAAIGFRDFEAARSFTDKLINSKLLPTAVEVINQAALNLTPGLGLKLPSGGVCVLIGLAGMTEEVDRESADIKAWAGSGGAETILEMDGAKANYVLEELNDNSLTKAAARLKANFRYGAWADFYAAAEAAGDWAVSVSPGLGAAWLCRTEARGDEGQVTANLRTEAMELSGTLVVEVFPPELKQSLDVWGPVPSSFPVFRNLKTEIDPANIMNPGRFVGGL